MEIHTKLQIHEANQSELNNQLQYQDMEITSQPEPPADMDIKEYNGSLYPTTIKTSEIKFQLIERLIQAMMAEVNNSSEEIKDKIFGLEAMYPVREEDEKSLLKYKASSDYNTMYM